MSEYPHEESGPTQHGSDTNLQNSLDESANNSIIGKVKSRVSSILPNRLSKWFSPSAKIQNDSLNGSVCGETSALSSRRRRRIEIEEEENYGGDDDVQHFGEYTESNRQSGAKKESSVDADDADDDSQNSDYEYSCSSFNHTRRDLNVGRQPPAKKSRLNVEIRDSPRITHHPLLSSTPAVITTHVRNYTTTPPASRYAYQRYTHLNLYGNQSKKEPSFNFDQQREFRPPAKIQNDIIDLITNSSYEHEQNRAESKIVYNSGLRNLNIPPTTSTLQGSEILNASVPHLKRQPLSTGREDQAVLNTVNVPPSRTSTTIHEVDHTDQCDDKPCYDDMIKKDDPLFAENTNAYNGSLDASNRPKLINGKGSNTSFDPPSNEGILLDSASESGESVTDAIKPNASNRKQCSTGLFNMSASATTRNSSRTSSFGNGLNFYSHLEGRKSLFSGPRHVYSNPINNSTLSLTSLNRRQFNASIYGSTSALSDSRLLNTFSPFYKGKTTYGGAAAYNKYNASTSGSAVRITPTLIRPTSSLSNFSSSCNSLTNNINFQVGENSAISSTAKRILDLINDFATPLSDAKKMANNLKSSSISHLSPHAKSRLNENDLNESRNLRLSQVRTPYSRPSVILQPSGNACGRSVATNSILPPVKELQVPTMSQLLQMKKMQNMTEKARKITQTSGLNSEYTLPEMESLKQDPMSQKDTQKHTNKIRNKVTKSSRPTAATKDLKDEEPPPPVNLPNIAFPIMQSVPKIDIQLKKQPESCKIIPENNTVKLPITTETKNIAKMDSEKSPPLAFNIPHKNSYPGKSTTIVGNLKEQSSASQTSSILSNSSTFIFSEPLQVVSDLLRSTTCRNVTPSEIGKYKFSPPLDITAPTLSNCTKQPQLKEGSCLDALSKPFALPPILSDSNKSEETLSSKTSLSSAHGFGNQFKKSVNDWECDACLVRNKSETNKCVACETPRKQISPESQPTISASVFATSSLGRQFRKLSNEWECEACMVRNKEETTKCVACETSRKCLPQVTVALPPIKNSFGDALKKKSGTWECQTCMITNKDDANECIACQTRKPGCTNTTQSAVPSSQFKFGFTSTGCTNSECDTGFQKLAAQQKASKWECDACMTRNDANRTKCACCEQPKPGISSVESAPTTSNKFEFGATAASKFRFGFGTASSAAKEEDIRNELSTKSQGSIKPPLTNLGTTQLASTEVGFQFGFKATAAGTNISKNDETDGNKQVTEHQFGLSNSSVELRVSDQSTVPPTPVGLETNSSPLTTKLTTISTPTSTMSSDPNVVTPSVKFSLPPAVTSTNAPDKDKQKGPPVFGFGLSCPTSSTGGFSFGSKIERDSSISSGNEKKPDSNTFKAQTTIATTKTSAFVFGSSAVNSSAAASFSTSLVTTTTTATVISATTSTTAVVKPVFSFGANIPTSSAISSQSAPAFNSFVFGSNTTNNAVKATSVNTLFDAVSSTSTLTSTSNATVKTSFSTPSTVTTTPASTNIFSSFGGGSSTKVPASPIFGSAVNPSANNKNVSSVSSSTNNPNTSSNPQFGSFGSKPSSNVFGSFGGAGNVGTKNVAVETPNATKSTPPAFGNVAGSSTCQLNQSKATGFVFGSKTASNAAVVTTTTTGSVTSTSTTWPKNSFVFGSVATTPTISAAPINENKDAKPSVFGTFGSCNTNANNQQQTLSIFGGQTSNTGSPLTSSGTTLSGPTSFSTNLFSTNSAPASTSIFGANSSGNAATPAFGSSPFGGTASSTSATPTFGSTAASGTTFGSFGVSASKTTTNTAEVKKPEAAFNFGAALSTQSTSGGFNFGLPASTSKPAFNFGGASSNQQPTFNFTGTTETQSSTKPFQFGAIPTAPVFNFNRGVLEGTPNAPFQFNAGAASVSSNIFAPTPTAGAPTTQQAKRKIRAPIRRVTQR